MRENISRYFNQLRHIFFRRRSSASRLAFTSGNTVRLCKGGGEFFSSLINCIDAARNEVAIETYIFRDDATGGRVSDALLRAAHRGLRVRMITDRFGTAWLPLFKIWLEAGIEHAVYNPYLFSRFGFSRTHRKLAVIDHNVAYCGGINIVDDYNQDGKTLPYPRWDFSVEMLGPIVSDVLCAFELQWRHIQVGNKAYSNNIPIGTNTVQPDLFHHLFRHHRLVKASALRNVTMPSVAFVSRDNILNRCAIEKAYLAAIGRAQKQILLANPYFMPGRKLRRALADAARRGVDVRILIGCNEFATLDLAVPFLYHMLLSAGVRIAEYDRTILHGKVAVIDNNWATVGSSNLDALSLVLNNEANIVLVRHDEPINILGTAITSSFEDSREIDRESYISRPFFERMLNWLGYVLYRMVMKVLTVGVYD
ncbi:MAG: phospholipase D-like domain-containing protein [Burkholderia sp.]|nr:phospholipase D-like domain-containing protein [Burkholderia sp.]